MDSKQVLEKIKKEIEKDKLVNFIDLGYGTIYDLNRKFFDRDVKLFMQKHYPNYTFELSHDGNYGRRLLLDCCECRCNDCRSL